MPTNLYNAHRQWALRPPDERFPSLEALHSFTDNCKIGSIEAQRALTQVYLKALAINGNSQPARLSHRTFSQWLKKAQALFLIQIIDFSV